MRPHPSRARLAAAGVLSCLVAGAGEAQERPGGNWPQWRGPGGQAHAASGAPLEWGAEQNVLWRTPIPGRGHSSPIVVGDRIFLTSAISGEKVPGAKAVVHFMGSEEFLHPDSLGADQRLDVLLLALERGDGALAWRRVARAGALPHDNRHRVGSYANPTPRERRGAGRRLVRNAGPSRLHARGGPPLVRGLRERGDHGDGGGHLAGARCGGRTGGGPERRGGGRGVLHRGPRHRHRRGPVAVRADPAGGLGNADGRGVGRRGIARRGDGNGRDRRLRGGDRGRALAGGGTPGQRGAEPGDVGRRSAVRGDRLSPEEHPGARRAGRVGALELPQGAGLRAFPDLSPGARSTSSATAASSPRSTAGAARSSTRAAGCRCPRGSSRPRWWPESAST